MRQLGSFLPGTGVGGAGVHWNGQTWRFLPARLHAPQPQRAALRRGVIPADMTIQDWGVTYDELEPYYDKFEYLCGISGKAGNLKGADPAGRQSVRRAARSASIPTPPLRDDAIGRTLFAQAARELGYHPFPRPAANTVAGLHEPARRAAGHVHLLRLLRAVRLRQLLQGQPADDHPAGAAAASRNFELRTECEVLRVNRDATGKTRDRRHLRRRRRATSSSSRPTSSSCAPTPAQRAPAAAVGHRQAVRPADRARASSASNYAYQITSSVDVFFDDKMLNPFIGAGALGIGRSTTSTATTSTTAGLGFIGGGYIALLDDRRRGRSSMHHGARGHAEVGLEVEEGGGGELPAQRIDLAPTAA